MRTLIIVLLLFSSSLIAREIVCIPNTLENSFDEIVISKQGRGNKYQLKVIKGEQSILQSQVYYRFNRRKQLTTIKSKDGKIEIRSGKLVNNKVSSASLKVCRNWNCLYQSNTQCSRFNGELYSK